ncbi:MAG TPA: GH116 family glycosyl hydrolase, partial [Bacteroidota bacterium]|nr:GH116 family glycosyl hydrolase [Bacteroidota bacterium]
QLGSACLVDQLVGEVFARVTGLGPLVDPAHVRATLRSIMRYNYRASLADHFNCMRTFALGDESALLMAAYPDGRPAIPFPYFPEVMTGFEYTAASGMLYEGDRADGLRCYRSIRARYDGLKRSPFDEAECGHHYGRAMASWIGVLALTGFHYSAVDGELAFGGSPGTYFWSSGGAYGTVRIRKAGEGLHVSLTCLGGSIEFRSLRAGSAVPRRFDGIVRLGAGETIQAEFEKKS